MPTNIEKKFVFRLQSGNNGQHDLSNSLKGWDESRMYDDKQIDAIESSNTHSEHEPTSIPSPFARIALAKTAFAEVAEHGEKALTAYQKIVSDSLDVGEILFTFHKWDSEVEIIDWDKLANLQKLSQHKVLHKTLHTFLSNDAEEYNYDRMKNLYILKHRKTGKVIGSTSPCTMFFASANKIDIPIVLSNDHTAFKGIFPLHKRDWEFQRYLYTWLKLNNETRQKDNNPVSIFKEIQSYLQSQKEKIGRYDELDEQNLPNDFTEYDELRAPDIDILGKKFHKLKENKLTTDSYLTVKDLLESKIIRLPYKIQQNSFFDGNLNESSKYSYLLPLTDKFFKRFTASDLKKIVRINEVGTNVEVKLEIPDKEPISKVYKESESITPLEYGFDCMLFPNVQFNRKEDAHYRFTMFLPYIQKGAIDNYSIDFYTGNDKIEPEQSFIRNTSDSQNPIFITYLLNQQKFDRIKVTFGGDKGFVIPVLQEIEGPEEFTFAVDFGTTNTHIEYKTESDHRIRPFDIKENDSQVHFFLVNPDTRNINALVADVDFIPASIGDGGIFNFPVRTALSISKNKVNGNRVWPFAQANVVIPYEKRVIPMYNRVVTQLKWESTEDEMGYYIDSLCIMIRNKVVLGNGNLSTTKIVWFYPLSMAGSRSKIIAEKWELAYVKYFLGKLIVSLDELDSGTKELLRKNLIQLPESVAPFLFYREDINYTNVINNLVSIDIGGGTTDIVFIKNGKKAEYVTSFRFAANEIFGLGENITPVVSKYRSEIEQIIEANDTRFELRNIIKGITGSVSGDLASFYFSLSGNELLKNVDINFNSMLRRDNEQKIVFVLFYAAIIYHTAQIMKAKDLDLPRHIAFSGNGSRTVNIIADKDVLSEFSKSIFEKVYACKYGQSGLDLIQNTKNPKEVTCKGGIKAVDKDYIQPPFEPVVFLGTDHQTFVADNDTYSIIDIEDSIFKTNEQVKVFIDFVLDDLLQQKYTKGVVPESFIRTLNINQQTIGIVKEVCSREEDLSTFTRNGIQRKMDSISDKASTQIEESFFFYPIASLLNAVSHEINNMN